MSGLDPVRLQRMLFESVGGRRFTQDSPIMPDVWMAYGRDPSRPQDLLLMPHWGARAGLTAHKLRTTVAAMRARLKVGRRAVAREPVRIAHLPGVIAAKLYFDELIRLVLPRTAWWARQVEAAARGFQAAAEPNLFPLPAAVIRELGTRIDKLAVGPSTAGAITPHQDVPPDFLWVAGLAGEISLDLARSEGRAPKAEAGSGLAQAEAFAALFADWSRSDDVPSFEASPETGVFRVALNRPAEAAVTQSALAVKADAARLLFSVSCKAITWAVVDSGIDGSHPAFYDWDAPAPSPGTARRSRVVRTYDFTRVRELLDPATTARLFRNGALSPEQEVLKQRLLHNLAFFGVPDPEQEAPRFIRQLRDRLEKGLEIDWSLLEPLLLVPVPEPPPHPHGTHVAGILGADWRVPAAPDPGSPAGAAMTSRMKGICPDIRLIDLRVLGSEGRSNEFEVIAALQFIRHLNSRADNMVIHGANLSLSTPHEVKTYACGSTPICEECDRLWHSGVVLVAAAGNNGHQQYVTAGNVLLDGYHPISITDPGNAEGVITVGATHRIWPHQYGVSYFSSRGPTGDGRRKPDLVAPGEKIDGPLPNEAMGTGDGTSLAAPHVSGGAAMLMARHSELVGRPVRIKKILCDTATDLGREPYFQGSGMLDILRALQSV